MVSKRKIRKRIVLLFYEIISKVEKIMHKSYLSANTLFHFTNSLDNLEGILRNEFYPHFCLEDNHILFPKEIPRLNYCKYEAVPMISFCDIPLSQISNHIKYYGDYCIGLKKEWGIENAINPVIYFHKYSDYCQNMKSMLLKLYREAEMVEKLNKQFEDLKELGKMFHRLSTNNFVMLGDHLLKLIFQSKPYKGKLWRNNRVINNVNFYDEKEWRFVPSMQTLVKNKIPLSLEEERFNDTEIRGKYTEILKMCCKLSFEPKDIKYIIVKDDKEILYMMRRIDEIKVKYSIDEKDLLKSRLISINQILEDF